MKLSEKLSIELKAAWDNISAYYARYQDVVRYKEKMIDSSQKKGYVSTLFNRIRDLPDIEHGNNRIRSEAEQMAINMPIRGTTADLIKKAMIFIHRRLSQNGLRTWMLLQVHDELVFEVPKKELDAVIPMVREEMEGIYLLRVPLKVDINKGRNWYEAH